MCLVPPHPPPKATHTTDELVETAFFMALKLSLLKWFLQVMEEKEVNGCNVGGVLGMRRNFLPKIAPKTFREVNGLACNLGNFFFYEFYNCT